MHADTTFPLTLKFENAGDVTIEVPVVMNAPQGMQEMAAKFEETMYAMEHSDADPMAHGMSNSDDSHDMSGSDGDEAAEGEMTHDMTASEEGESGEGEMSRDTSASGEGESSEESAAPRVQPTPRAAEDLKGGFFVNMTTDDIDRAAMAVGFATKVLNNTEKPVTIFFNTQGVRLVDTHIPQKRYDHPPDDLKICRRWPGLFSSKDSARVIARNEAIPGLQCGDCFVPRNDITAELNSPETMAA